jgi:tetratricopeptide (TPR) repeat protein
MEWILILGISLILVIIISNRNKKSKPIEVKVETTKPISNINTEISSPEISNERLEEIKNEALTDKKKYILNLKNSKEYSEAAMIIFSSVYKKMDNVDKFGNPWLKYNSKSEEFKKNNDIDGEIELLEKAIAEDVYTPFTYERLAILYSKKKDYNSAYIVCKKWFNTDYWKIPNMLSGSLKLMDRMEKLESKLNK